MTSKARTLEFLSDKITSAEVLPLYYFSVKEYRSAKDRIIAELTNTFNSKLIVRSSSQSEDQSDCSNAGKYLSLQNVSAETDSLKRAIEQVISSYGDISGNDEVLVQPMLANVGICGVAFTADRDTLAPYYIINYEDNGSTTAVTDGTSKKSKTYISYKNYIWAQNESMQKVINLCRECEQLLGSEHLDIEFAFACEKLYLLQARPIACAEPACTDIPIDINLFKIHRKMLKLNGPHPKMMGNRTIFGVMPDWNPAEIIGIKPKRLALSLYKELITDEIWAYQRDNYGYRNMRSFPLLVSFLGLPYIDVRVSFNSFVPKELDMGVAEKLIDFYLKKLAEKKTYHDKVEFDIVYSCYFFGIDEKLCELEGAGFTKGDISQIKDTLLKLTNNILANGGHYDKDVEKIEMLDEQFVNVTESSMQLIDKIYWLIEDCKRYGTLPFAGIARAAFIATQMLRSLVDSGILSASEHHSFLKNLNTVSKQMGHDYINLSPEQFIEKFGHLRPGTYNIVAPRYDAAFDQYFDKEMEQPEKSSFQLNKTQLEKIAQLINEHGISSTPEAFIAFIKNAIENREYAKLKFTRHLSQILNYIEELGAKFSIDKNEMQFIDIKTLKDLYATLDHRDLKDILTTDINKNVNYYNHTMAVHLPKLIVNNEDIYAFHMEETEPNFITLSSARANVSRVTDNDHKGKIVCIESADPGYDYLFTKNIAGLVTCYGGVNSHMAVRASELGIPAVIGAGEQLYKELSEATTVYIDCGSKVIEVIS